MSAFELPAEHLHAIVAAAHRLGITQLVRADATIHQLGLDTRAGRQALVATLSAANGSGTSDEDRAGTSSRLNVRLTEPSGVVQMLQWIRCYEYQCVGRSDWRSSDAQTVCALLTGALLDRLAAVFSATWTNDPTEVDAVASRCMRTTLDIDDDLVGALKPLAVAKQVSLGRVVSDLVREALAATATATAVNGFPVFDVPPSSRIFGPDEVRVALED